MPPISQQWNVFAIRFFSIISRTKAHRFVIVRISPRTVYATNLVAYSYNRSWFNRCELGTGLVLEHRTCTNLSCRESLHREWRHMLPSTPPAKFHQEMLSCPQIYLPHRIHVQSLVCFTHVHTSLQQIYISLIFIYACMRHKLVRYYTFSLPASLNKQNYNILAGNILAGEYDIDLLTLNI